MCFHYQAKTCGGSIKLIQHFHTETWTAYSVSGSLGSFNLFRPYKALSCAANSQNKDWTQTRRSDGTGSGNENKMGKITHPQSPPSTLWSLMRRTQINSPERCVEEGRDEMGEGTVRRVGCVPLCCKEPQTADVPQRLVLSQCIGA